jgi:ankyrin repeat protein
VKLALQLGNDVNATNSMGYTALHGAAIRGANSIVEFLVKSGIRIDAKDKKGRTALVIAENGAGDSTQRRQLNTAALLEKLTAQAQP